MRQGGASLRGLLAEGHHAIRLVERQKIGSSGTFTWVATDFLLANKIRPYADLPVWQVGSGRTAGFNRFDLAPELKAGLKYRPLEESATDTLEWFRKHRRTARSS